MSKSIVSLSRHLMVAVWTSALLAQQAIALDFSSLTALYQETYVGEAVGSSTMSPEIDLLGFGGLNGSFVGNGASQLPALDGTVANVSLSASAGAAGFQASNLVLDVVPALDDSVIGLRGSFESVAYTQGGPLITAQVGVSADLGANLAVAGTVARVVNGAPGSPFMLITVIEQNTTGTQFSQFADLTASGVAADILAGDAFEIDLEVDVASSTAVASVTANGTTVTTPMLSLTLVGSADSLNAAIQFGGITNGLGDDDTVAVEMTEFQLFGTDPLVPPVPGLGFLASGFLVTVLLGLGLAGVGWRRGVRQT